MPRLSIVIPYLRSAQRFEDTLVSVLENRPGACEVIVVHDGSYDDPYEIDGEVDVIVEEEASTFTELTNIGIEESDAPIVHVLKPGVTVQEGWIEPALSQFMDPHIASVSPLILDEEAPETIVAAGVQYGVGGSRRVPLAGSNLTSRRPPRAKVLGPTTIAAFYRRSVVELVGGLDSSVGETASDVDLACTLKHLGYRTAFEPASRVLWRAEQSQHSAVQTGLHFERLFWRHARQFGIARAITVHPFSVLRSFLGSDRTGPLSLFGRVKAWFETASYAEYREMLENYSEESDTVPMQMSADETPVDRRMAA